MRVLTAVALLILPVAAFAQAPPCTRAPSGLPQFDPYKPSHAEIIRNYGSTMLAHVPLETLLKLDPYVPTEGALLRQVGGAIPVWWYPPLAWNPSAVPSPPCEPVVGMTAPVITTFSDVVAELRPSSRAPRPSTTADRNRGISIEYDGRSWISAGPAVAFSETAFVRVGERAGTPVYQRAGTTEPVIYIATTAGMVAPFRAVP